MSYKSYPSDDWGSSAYGGKPQAQQYGSSAYGGGYGGTKSTSAGSMGGTPRTPAEGLDWRRRSQSVDCVHMGEVVRDRWGDFRRIAAQSEIPTIHISELEADVVIGIK